MTVNDQDKWRDDTDRPREDYPQTISARAAYGGIKWGSAFFGWLSAMGLAVLLTALLAAVGAAVGVSKGATVDQAAAQASENVQTVGIAGGIGLAVILFISYFCGGFAPAGWRASAACARGSPCGSGLSSSPSSSLPSRRRPAPSTTC